jgi:hypothetical protein
MADLTGDIITALTRLGSGVASAFHRLTITVGDGENMQAARFEQADVTNHPRAVTIVQRANNYSLKVDHYGNQTALDISNLGSPEHGIFNGLAVNTVRSTVKVTNTAVQTEGAVIAALGTNPGRSAPIVNADNYGAGPSFNARQFSPAAVGVDIRLHASQAADALVVRRESNPQPMSGLDRLGRLFFNGMAQIAARAGGRSVPTKAEGFLPVIVDGQEMLVPYFKK